MEFIIHDHHVFVRVNGDIAEVEYPSCLRKIAGDNLICIADEKGHIKWYRLTEIEGTLITDNGTVELPSGGKDVGSH